MNNGWIKIFDYGEELGLDDAVDRGKASWSKGKLNGMIGAAIKDKKVGLVAIHGQGEYWQSDDFEVNLSENTPKRIKRRIQKKVDSSDIMICLDDSSPDYRIFRFIKPKDTEEFFRGVLPIPHNVIGSWFTVEVDCNNGEISWSYKDRI